ncbi:MAG: serine/threonine-protein kinase [Planctomycetota bacterium]
MQQSEPPPGRSDGDGSTAHLPDDVACRLDGGPQDDAIDAAARTRLDGVDETRKVEVPRALPEIPGIDVRRVVGTGSSGTVYLGRRKTSGRPRVAVKVLAASLRGTVVEERFRREVEITSRLDCVHIVKTTAAGVTDGLPFVVSDWVAGRSMTGLGPIAVGDAVAVGRQMAIALTHMERAGVVHRDVKPGNIVSDGADRGGLRATLIDFGLARGPDDDETEHGLLSPRQSLGSPNYLAPEQLEHPGRVDCRADLYALGSTLYELICGRPPFVGKPRDVLQAKLSGDPACPIESRVDGLPADLPELVGRLLRIDREGRPGSPREVLDTFRDIETRLSDAG